MDATATEADPRPASDRAKSMTVALFGASGRTGRHLLERALERGHRIVALARTPAKIAREHPALAVIEGDVQDPDVVDRVVAGVDAVVSVLGPSANTPDYQVERGTRNILAAMERHGVERLVITAGAGVEYERDRPGIADRLVKRLLLLVSRHVYEDMRRTVEAVRSSGVRWTVVRVPMLTDSPGGGEVRSGYLGSGVGIRIARADVARFVLDVLEEDSHVGDLPVISN